MISARQREVYLAFLREPPPEGHDQTGTSSAYWLGYKNPAMRMPKFGYPILGAPASEARAAFLAGQTAARRTKELMAKHPKRGRLIGPPQNQVSSTVG